ncbi:hypothetical protein HMPREF9439_00412 [Parasutterella excrementihominis YIT 11859]|jgi:hypothetical protein|uniref:Uncharacterized protein n=1 Tax=Parasutterella excrementihominis YIT 11859 TaxID=762966 RepID=F3QHL5_9BURK|nr:hypothetical protein HMPREF9439_00412 [Parasutterella excrementihominis YIT 11859]
MRSGFNKQITTQRILQRGIFFSYEKRGLLGKEGIVFRKNVREAL